MIGAIAGDIIGSAFEASPIKSKEFPLFSQNSTCTDDSVWYCQEDCVKLPSIKLRREGRL
jgi:ADP-ribosylglycohydrolase